MNRWLERFADDPRLNTTAPRLRTAEATLGRIRPHLTAHGITRLADLTGLDRVGVPVVAAMRPLARAVAVSLGKGLTKPQAQAGAAMESLETWHAERFAGPLLWASLAELETGQALVASNLIVSDERTLPNLIDLENLPKETEAPFPRERRLPWAIGYDLAGDGPVAVPFEAVHADYTQPGPPRSCVLACSTNGLASGNHPVEALEQALFELIERDAAARFDALPIEGQHSRRLEPGSVADPGCRWLLGRCAKAGLAAALFDLPAKGGLSAALALVDGDRNNPAPPCRGTACARSPAQALRGALLEALQTRLTFIAGARDDLKRAAYGREAVARARAAAFPLLEAIPARACANEPEPSGMLERVNGLIEALRSDGVGQIGAVEIPSSIDGIAVTRAVAPGLIMEPLE